MRTCVIGNPVSGSSGRIVEVRKSLEKRSGLEWLETESPQHATDLAADAVSAGFDLIIAAGGDGTVNEVVNGMSRDFTGSALGIIPLGTANDFARSLNIPLDPVIALLVIERGTYESIDVIKAEFDGGLRYLVNVASGGFSGKIGEAVSADLKRRWGPLAYLMSAVDIIPEMEGYETVITHEDGESETLNALNIFVANGRFTGGGINVAPNADLCDGALDLVTVLKGEMLDLTCATVELAGGPQLECDAVRRRRVAGVHISSGPEMPFNFDGEPVTDKPVKFTTEQVALRVSSNRYASAPVPD